MPCILLSNDFEVTNASKQFMENLFCLYNLKLILHITIINTNIHTPIPIAMYVTSDTLTYSILSYICDCSNKSILR